MTEPTFVTIAASPEDEQRGYLAAAMVEEMLTWPAYRGVEPGDDDYPQIPEDCDYSAFNGDMVARAAIRAITMAMLDR